MFKESDIIFNNIYPYVKKDILKSIELNRLYRFFKNVKVIPYKIVSKGMNSESFQSSEELFFASEK